MKLFWNVRLSRTQFARCLGLLFVSLAGATFADESESSGTSPYVENRRDLFANEQLCEAYKTFLLAEEVEDGSECDSIARVIIASQGASDAVYLERILELTTENSSLGSVARLLDVSRTGTLSDVYNQAGVAGRRMAITLSHSGDIERATLYSHLVFAMQSAIAVAFCKDSAACTEIRRLSSVEDLFGPRFSALDQLSPDRMLFCLLRTDNYRLPVLELVQSPRFGVCIRRT